MKFTFVDRIVLKKRQTPGVNWSSDCFVLVHRGHKELWWWTARPYYLGSLGGTVNQAAELIPVDTSANYPLYKQRTLHEGGRLSRKLLGNFASEIAEFFGCEQLPILSPRKTPIISED